MRLKVALPVLALGALLVTAVLWLRPGSGPAPLPRPVQAADAAPAATTQTPPAPKPVPQPVTRAESVVPGASAHTPEAGQQAYVAERVAELEDLAADNSPASLNTIVSELTNRDPRIRQAAREAAVQFGSRDAIPKLLDAAEQTDDPQEKVALQQAAAFLELPTPAELAASGHISQAPPPASPAGNPAPRPR